MKCTLLQRDSPNHNGDITTGANTNQGDTVINKEGKENTSMQVREPDTESPTNTNSTSSSPSKSRTKQDTDDSEEKKENVIETMANGHSGMNGLKEPPKSILKIKQESAPSVEESSDVSSRTTESSSASSASSAKKRRRKRKVITERIARANLGLSEFTGVEITLEMGNGVIASHYPGDSDLEVILERKPTKVRFNSDDEVMEYVPWSSPWSYQK
jgi:hypothetical protein